MKKISTYSNFSVRQSAKLRDFEPFVCTSEPAPVNMVLIEYASRISLDVYAQLSTNIWFEPSANTIPSVCEQRWLRRD